MSSHREAPEISKDPVADGTDVYAFVSPNRPDYVTLIANFIPLQKPDGGPNFYEFGDDVLYEIHVNNRGDATRDVSFQFTFTTKIRNDKTFLYNIGPIDTIGSPNWNRPQFYSLTRVDWKGDKKNKEVAARQGTARPAGERRSPQHSRTTRSCRPRPCRASSRASRSSAASGPTRSTSTSAASSTSARCVR